MRTLRVLYATGPGDVAGTFEHWERGESDPTQLSVTYSSQFYDAWLKLGFHAFVISPASRTERITRPRITIDQRPIPWQKAGGLRFHIGRLVFACRLIYAASRFRAHIAIITSGTHWFLLSALSFLGMAVVPSLHTNACDPGLAVTRMQKLVLCLNRRFFLKRCRILLCASPSIASDIGIQAASTSHSVRVFLPTYPREDFDGFGRANWESRPWKVLYVGRLEKEKGALDMLTIVHDLVRNGCDAVLDICGAGACEALMRSRVNELGLQNHVRFHGHVGPADMRKALAACHVVVAPTRLECGEGFNQVPVEAVLARRPVISSHACPSLAIVSEGAIEVRPNDVEDYVRAILALSQDRALYDARVAGCERYREELLGTTKSWGAHVERLLTELIRRPERAGVQADASSMRERFV
jgi:glycosyltransferase involved in cell wall biosynthesis